MRDRMTTGRSIIPDGNNFPVPKLPSLPKSVSALWAVQVETGRILSAKKSQVLSGNASRKCARGAYGMPSDGVGLTTTLTIAVRGQFRPVLDDSLHPLPVSNVTGNFGMQVLHYSANAGIHPEERGVESATDDTMQRGHDRELGSCHKKRIQHCMRADESHYVYEWSRDILMPCLKGLMPTCPINLTAVANVHDSLRTSLVVAGRWQSAQAARQIVVPFYTILDCLLAGISCPRDTVIDTTIKNGSSRIRLEMDLFRMGDHLISCMPPFDPHGIGPSVPLLLILLGSHEICPRRVTETSGLFRMWMEVYAQGPEVMDGLRRLYLAKFFNGDDS